MQVLKFLLIFSQKFRILYRKVLIIDIPWIITNAKISKWMFLCQPPILYDPWNHYLYESLPNYSDDLTQYLVWKDFILVKFLISARFNQR